MQVLNCESFQTALESVSDLYDADEKSVLSTLKKISFNSTECKTMSWEDYVFSEFEKSLGRKAKEGKTLWFHLTRCKIGTMFVEGILPTNLVLPRIQREVEEIIALAIEQKKIPIKSTGIPNGDCWAFGWKMNNKMHWGPYAMLVREIAFSASAVGNHDYLSMPEIVEDILGLDSRCDELKNVYRETTKPCIVKFSTDGIERYTLRAAIFYLFSKINNHELSIHCNTCFDGKGEIIPAENILAVEFL